MTYLDQQLDADQFGWPVQEAAVMSSVQRRPGESLQSWGTRLKAADRKLWASQAKKTGSGSSNSGSPGAFEQLHPRGRGGQWIVKQGQTGAEVRAVQNQVGTSIDGQFGNLTKQAVMRFQRQHGLEVDGIVGAQTVAAMMGKRRAAQVKAAPMTAADRKWLLSQKRSSA